MANYKRLFLTGHSYYITIVTHKRNPILIDNIESLRDSFRESKKYYIYNIDDIVILPDHIHMIITPKIATNYPKIVRAIKYNFSNRVILEEEQSYSRYQRGLTPIWQKRYYEHTIRDEDDYLRCIKYMKNNPVKHNLVKNIKDWKYSSFW
ncbi:Transposase and inactivated derivatives [hydrothermal vent metagenome]|uniref:Transposase and inactivated derivatives n=1 Tax=hydrothermal vent metagenome TaxID=652676 RepID=A0A1W1EJA8_9ZZZZ